jgi:site-specific recombinase XerD
MIYVSHIVNFAILYTSTNENPCTEISGMESFRRIKEAAGVSKQTFELLAAGWRKGTQTAYNSCWRQWSSWCHTRQINPFHTSVENIADFLAELYARKYEYRTINNYRSAISPLHAEVEGKKVGKHELICQLMTGIFNKHPLTPRYIQMCDVNKVLSYIYQYGE